MGERAAPEPAKAEYDQLAAIERAVRGREFVRRRLRKSA